MNQFSHKETRLSQRIARGGAWVFALRITQQVFSLARLVVLARILAPDAFGLLGVALLSMATLETFSQTGFQTALIQKKEDIRSYLDSAWTVSILRGVALFAILYLTAPYAASFFQAPEAALIIRAIGCTVLFQAVTNIGLVYYEKELEFKRLYIYHLCGTLADFAIAVSAAFALRSVWALVLGLLASSIVKLVASYIIHPYRPSLRFDLIKVKELAVFGKWIFGSSILVFLISQGDDIFVGKLLGLTALGFYQMAYKISNIPATEISSVISQVSFPAYSKIQDDLPRLREGFLKVLQLTAFLSFPAAGMIFILAPDFTVIFLGEKWLPMVPVMQVLVIWGVVRSIGTVAGQVFVSTGNPGIVTKLQFWVLIILIILIYPLSVKWGIVGTSMAVLFSTLLPNLAAFYLITKATGCGVINFGRATVTSLVNTGFPVLLVFLLKTRLINTGLPELVLLIMLFIGAYLCMTYMVDRLLNYRLFDNIKINIQSLKGW